MSWYSISIHYFPHLVPIHGIKTLFKICKHQTPCSVPWLDTVHIITIYIAWTPCYEAPLSPWHGTSSVCRWRRRVAANKLNKEPQTADKECASSLVAGYGSNNLSAGSRDPTGYLWQVIRFWKRRSTMIRERIKMSLYTYLYTIPFYCNWCLHLLQICKFSFQM
jgi:hypothetical protein